MKELLEYREKLINRVAEATKEFCLACESFENPFEKISDDWNVHQIASHTRDVEKFVYGERVHKTLLEDKPHFKSFDADSWMATSYKNDEPLKNILEDLTNNIFLLCKTLKEMPHEAWSRLSSHESAGNELTLQLWVERSLAHIEEHLHELKK
jgi:hypothetical protein